MNSRQRSINGRRSNERSRDEGADGREKVGEASVEASVEQVHVGLFLLVSGKGSEGVPEERGSSVSHSSGVGKKEEGVRKSRGQKSARKSEKVE